VREVVDGHHHLFILGHTLKTWPKSGLVDTVTFNSDEEDDDEFEINSKRNSPGEVRGERERERLVTFVSTVSYWIEFSWRVEKERV